MFHLKEKLNSWRLKAEIASWRACTKLWGLDPGCRKINHIVFKGFSILCAFKDACQSLLVILYYRIVTKPQHKRVSGLPSVTICLITWCYVGHGLQNSSDEMSHVLKLCLWQIKDLIGCIKIKVPCAMCQQSLIRGRWRNRDRLGQQQNNRGEQGAVCKQLDDLATKQENGRVLGREAVQRSWDKLPIMVLLDRIHCSC